MSEYEEKLEDQNDQLRKELAETQEKLDGTTKELEEAEKKLALFDRYAKVDYYMSPNGHTIYRTKQEFMEAARRHDRQPKKELL